MELLKGQCHEMDFFEGLNILISAFCACTDGFQGLSKAFTTLYNYYIFICFFETLTNFENAYLNSPQNSLLCDWSMFSNADHSLVAGKMRKN
jgi:hypothetical protein